MGRWKPTHLTNFMLDRFVGFIKTIKIKMIQEIGKIFNKIREIEIRYVNKKVIRFVNKQQS